MYIGTIYSVYCVWDWLAYYTVYLRYIETGVRHSCMKRGRPKVYNRLYYLQLLLFTALHNVININMVYTFCTYIFIKITNLWPGQRRVGRLLTK